MKLLRGIFLILVLITVFAQLGSSKFVSKREESNYENGTDIVVIKPALLDVVLTQKNLTFEFCDNNCDADFAVCFEPAFSNQSALLDLCNSKCGFNITTNSEAVSFLKPFGQYHIGEDRLGTCHTVSMKYKWTKVSQFDTKYRSCDPKIENGIVTLNITSASSECPMTIKNAKFVPTEVPTPDPSSNENPPNNKNLENASQGSLQGSPFSSATSKTIENYFGWIFVLLVSFYLLQ